MEKINVKMSNENVEIRENRSESRKKFKKSKIAVKYRVVER